MRRKLKENGGFSIVEMLCAVVILVLLCLLINSGLSMAMKSYRDVTAESETRLLLNDLSDALADRLRYAVVTVKQTVDPGGNVTTDECDFSLDNVSLEDDSYVKSVWKPADGSEPEETGWVSDKGQFMVGTKRLLSSGAYGSERSDKRRYEVRAVRVMWSNDGTRPDPDDTGTLHGLNDLRESQTLTFYIEMEVKDTWGGVSEKTELTVRCLNPVRKEV